MTLIDRLPHLERIRLLGTSLDVPPFIHGVAASRDVEPVAEPSRDRGSFLEDVFLEHFQEKALCQVVRPPFADKRHQAERSPNRSVIGVEESVPGPEVFSGCRWEHQDILRTARLTHFGTPS